MSMPEPGRLIGYSRDIDGYSRDIELEFVERAVTPQPAMKLGIQLHAAGLSLSDTVSVLSGLGVDRVYSTVHNWVQKPAYSPRLARARITLRTMKL